MAKRAFLYIVLLANALVTLSFWWRGSSPYLDGSLDGGLIAVGRLFGLTLQLAILLQIILISRLPLVEKPFGFDKLNRAHRNVGLAIVASIVANLIVMVITRALFPIPAEFLPLSAPPIIFFTTVFIAIAGVVFLIVGRLSRNPVRAYTIVAVIALILSLVPDFGLLANPAGMPGATTITCDQVTKVAIGARLVAGSKSRAGYSRRE